MNRLIAEFEMFCYVVETRPHVLYIPMLWLGFCVGMAFFINNLNIETSHMFYDIVHNKLQKQHAKVLMAGIIGFFSLTWTLYRKHRKRLF